MAKSKKQGSRKKRQVVRRSRGVPTRSSLEPGSDSDIGDSDASDGTTGRFIVTFGDASAASIKSGLNVMRKHVGVAKICRSSDFAAQSFDQAQADSADAFVLEELGVAIVSAAPEGIQSFSAMTAAQSENMIVEAERINYALGLEPDVPMTDEPTEASGELLSVSVDFLRGYQRGVAEIVESLSNQAEDVAQGLALQTTAAGTWGLRATRVLESPRTGRGVRVAVLDTGMDLNHPDFRKRSITGNSFVPGQSVQDGNGHGTHCIGTACGPRVPGIGPRYGIAFESEIFAGKVLSNAGRGGDGGILAGINWALRNRCRVISMSLGRGTRPGEPPMQAYERAASRALRMGTLIVAAAGNDSSRPAVIRPVASPANCPSIAAVAAVDSRMKVARFSNGGINPNGGEINLAGPGVGTHSSWPMPTRLRSISGTSMATPHVAGIAAFVAELTEGGSGIDLYRELRRLARPLSLPRRDIGNGLVQAPTNC